jgi:hypothetical protein
VPFDVETLPGLVFWVDATRGVNTPANNEVLGWQDQSPSRNDLTLSNYYPTGYVPNGPGGHAVIRFGMVTWMSTAEGGTSSFGFGTGDLLVEEVWASSNQLLDQPALFATQEQYKVTSSGGSNMLLQPSGLNVEIDGLSGDPLVSSALVGDTNLHLVGVRRAAAAGLSRVELRVDGRLDQVATAVPSDLQSRAVAGMGGGTSIAEVIVVKGPISDQNLVALEAYLMSKYGLK